MNGPLWTSQDIIRATRGRCAVDFAATGVSIDTRSIQPGDLFVALQDVRDGHDFVADALAAGAAGALVNRKPEGVANDAPLLVVNNVLQGLEKMAEAARARTQARVIGVTGSVGKTGVKEMLRTALSTTGLTHAPEKSFNNHWGVPLTLARMAPEVDFAAIEMGMNHPGEISPLSRLSQPDAAIITTIAPVHMAAFENVEQIADAKAEIFDGLRKGGAAILNADNPYFDRLASAAKARGAQVLAFGHGDACDARLEHARVTSAATVVK
ncbi:MAG: UDP-N-acetylmuramoyl-tripeptide--D-alanyl-D-alanine ligase, partial [Pikeienuella sp.]